jgi:hypothetical protein
LLTGRLCTDGLTQCFFPVEPISRALFAKVLVTTRCHDAGAASPWCTVMPAGQSYIDVPPSHYAFAFVQRGHALHLFDHESDGTTFDPNAQITRRAATLWTFQVVRDRDHFVDPGVP